MEVLPTPLSSSLVVEVVVSSSCSHVGDDVSSVVAVRCHRVDYCDGPCRHIGAQWSWVGHLTIVVTSSLSSSGGIVVAMVGWVVSPPSL